MPIFRYYNPYRKTNFYNYYRPTYRSNYAPVSPPSYTPNSPSNNETTLQAVEKTSISSQNRSKSESDDNVWLDLLGIKLYFDDVLILSLLFFLYKEEVKDEGLFLALVLLLIS